MDEEGTADNERSVIIGTAPGASGATGAPPPGESTLETGRTIELGPSGSRYEIVRSLGRGGMSDVFLALRLSAAGFAREVALKCVTADFEPNEAVRRMFMYEARLSSHLRHPGIAEAYDLEQFGSRLYLVLEYIDGVSLRSVIRGAAERRVTVPVEFACHVAACVAEALHYAHGLAGPDGEPLGIVHRDVSGSNVMVTRTGIPKLVDFGIAFARMQGRDRTGTGLIRGTYAYLSPEQAAGREVDGRSDLFSLGILLVEMLTGLRVFERGEDSLMAQAIEECSATRVAEATRELQAPLQKICRRALAKKPSDRFQDGEEFSRALRGVLVEMNPLYGPRQCAADLIGLGVLPGAGRDVPTGSSAGRRRGRAKRRVASLVLAALAVGVAAGALGIWVAPRVTSVATLPPASARAPKDLRPDSEQGSGERGGRAAAASGSVPASLVPSRNLGPDAVAQGSVSPLAPPATPPAGSLPDEVPIVRRKRPPGTVSRAPMARPEKLNEVLAVAQRPAQDPPGGDRSPAVRPAQGKRSALLRFADRGTVANAAETLARGTLIRVKLATQVDATQGGPAEAVVTEDVLSNGSVLVPSGSVVRCRAGGLLAGRIGLSCDSMRAGERAWSFSAIALGEGERAGLQVIEGTIQSGTPFVVFVTASAVLE